MPAENIAYWTARVAELEAELDAAKKLSEVRLIAAELMRTREAIKKAKAELGRVAPHLKRGKPQQNGRRSASSAAEPASS